LQNKGKHIMAVNDIVMSAAGGSTDANYIESCFSTYLYTGNGSTQTITNGIDLSGKGGLVWIKNRSDAYEHKLTTTPSYALVSNSTAGLAAEPNGLTAFSSSGFTVGVDGAFNFNGNNFVSWTFRKQPKFFDIVTYTGNGASSRQITHNLGSVPGCIIIKCTSTAVSWVVASRANDSTYRYLVLNDTGAQTGSNNISTYATSTYFDTQGFTNGGLPLGNVNQSGRTYVAYLFAHDAGGFGLSGTDNVINCGSFTTNGGGAATVNLGYEPQWIMIKASSGVSNWTTIDNMRGFTATTGSSNNSARLFPNNANAEGVNDTASPNATGFTTTGLTGGLTFIYIAIRRPMKTPTTGTEVFLPQLANTSAPTYRASFTIDMVMALQRTGGSHYIGDRLRGAFISDTTSTAAEAAYANEKWDYQTSALAYASGPTYEVGECFRRAPGFFDVVCYTGTGVARTVNHNLGVVPELIFVKSRTDASNWFIYNATTGNTKYLILNADNISQTASTVWNNTTPTSTVFSLGTSIVVNKSASNFVAYLFATCAGVSKVGSYTGNGSSQTIACGFTAGARFVLIKRTDSTGDWYVWDTARGIVAGNDPHLSLNTTAAEVTTDDSIDAASSGFIVNQLAATNINVNAATYIFLAIA
jgi:hypothetical protein